MSVQEILSTFPPFLRLNSQQQAACLAYCTNGRDPKLAAEAEGAYPTKTGEGQVRRLAKDHKDFRACVDAIFEPEIAELTFDEALKMLSREARSQGKDWFKALQEYIKLKGWSKGAPEPDEPEAPTNYPEFDDKG